MRQHKLSRDAVARAYAQTKVGTARHRHLLACVLELNKDFHKQGKKQITVVNTSQSINRSVMSTKCHLPVLTPGGKYYHVATKRYLTSEEAMLLMGFDLASLDLGTLSSAEIARLAGNAMHVRAVGVAWLIGLGLIDRTAFSTVVAKNNGRKRTSKLVGDS